MTGATDTETPDAVGDNIEAKAIDTMHRAQVYLDLLQYAEENDPRENCLDCTFCGAWFPAYWLLDITPQGTADWRNHYYRCCFKCISGDTDDYYWFTSHPSLSPALHNQPGTAVSPSRTDYKHHDRTSVAELDADCDRYPKRWVITLDEDSPHQRKLYIEAAWSEEKLRWVRRVIMPRTTNPRQSPTLDVDTFYKMCQKVITIRRRVGVDQHRERNTYWAAASAKIQEEHPEFNKAEVRAQVRARILALVNQLTADIYATSDTERARIMAAFRQSDEESIKAALDPDWDRHAFFDRIDTDNHLTECLSVYNQHHGAALRLQEDRLSGSGGQQALASTHLISGANQGTTWTLFLPPLPQSIQTLDPTGRPRARPEGPRRGSF